VCSPFIAGTSLSQNPVLHPMKLRKIGEKEVYFYTSLW